MKDYYKILNVQENATQDEIKRAYRKLAKKYHPDRNANDDNAKSMFQDVNEAYGILGNEESRAKYDSKKENKKEFNKNENKTSSKKTSEKNSARSKEECMNDLNNYFENFFGFDAKSNNVNKEKLKKKKNPIDTSNMFNSFFNLNKK